MKILPNSLIQFLRRLKQFLQRSRKTIFLIVAVSVITLVISSMTAAWLSRFHVQYIPSLGTIRVIGLEVYGDGINLTDDGIPFINWGAIYPGIVINRSLYINNTSNTPVTLNIEISNITFQDAENQNVTENLPIETPLKITWNYNNAVLEPKEEIYVTLTLEVSSNKDFLDYLIAYNVTKFSFDITITPSEAH